MNKARKILVTKAVKEWRDSEQSSRERSETARGFEAVMLLRALYVSRALRVSATG